MAARLFGSVLVVMGGGGLWYAFKGNRQKLKKIVGTDKPGIAAAVSVLAILVGLALIVMAYFSQ